MTTPTLVPHSITDAQYTTDSFGENVGVKAVFDGQETWIPMDSENRMYREILKQVESGDLTIADAE